MFLKRFLFTKNCRGKIGRLSRETKHTVLDIISSNRASTVEWFFWSFGFGGFNSISITRMESQYIGLLGPLEH